MARFRRILCPVDFFPASLKAFDYALKLASHYKARVHVLHVVGPVTAGAYETPPYVVDLIADMGRESGRRLQRLEAKALKAKVRIGTEVRAGDIDVEILRVAEARQADLIVMGTHGRRGFKRWVLGSVVERIMRHSPVPLLTTGSTATAGSAPLKIRRILVTTDFSAGTPDALAYAFSIARECRARITLLHVVRDLSFELGPEFTTPLIRKARESLEKLAPSDVRAEYDVRIRVEVGTPYRVIQEIIESEKPGLVVMNTHGKAMIDRVFFGSTAERVVRAASDKCSVLLIPPASTHGRRKKKSA